MRNEQASGLEGLRVLVVEDMAVVADEIGRMVREFGCEVVGPVGSLSDAQAAAQNERFDAALLDINLNGQSALPVADELADREIPFIIMSGYGREILAPPFDSSPSIEKPFSRNELRQVMIQTFVREHTKHG